MKNTHRVFGLLVVMSTFLLGACGSNNSGGGEKAKEGTALYRSYQLANNVEKLPNTTDIYGSDNAKRSGPMRKNAVSDETNPSDDVTKYPAYNSYYSALWDAIDGQVEEAKETKNFVISNIYCFNTWVRGSGGTDYRLNYDANRDAATIETMFEESEEAYSYTNTYASYDEEGRMLIDSVSYCLSVQDNEIRIIGKNAVSYVEGLYWDFTQLERQDEFGEGGIVHNYVIHADLTQEEKEITQIHLYRVFGNDGSIADMEARPSIQTSTEYLNFVVDNDSNGNISSHIYDKKGYNYLQGDGMGSVFIPLYRLSGYDKIENRYEGDDWANGERYLTIGGQTYGGQKYDYNGLRWRVSSMVSGPSVEPALQIIFHYADYNETQAAQLIRDFLSSLDLAYKEDHLDEAFHLEMNKKTLCEEREAFGKKNYLYVSLEEFNDLYERYDLGDFTMEDLRAYQAATKVSIENQLQDDGYYSVVSSSAVGSYAFDQENETISIGQVALTAEKNALFNKDTDYVGVVALKSGRDIIVLNESDPVQFDGVNDIEATIPASSFDIKELPANNDEAFEVVAYLALKNDGVLARCSSVSPISYTGEEVEYLISTYDTRDHEQEDQPGEGYGDYIKKEYFSIVNSEGKHLNKHYFTTESVPFLPDED